MVDDRGDRILFPVRLAFLIDQHQAVHIRVHRNTQVGVLRTHPCGKAGQVLRDRFGSVAEHPAHIARHLDHVAAQFAQERGDDGAAGRVDTIDHDPETTLPDHVRLHQGKCQHKRDVSRKPVTAPLKRADRIPCRIRVRLAGALPESGILCSVQEEPRGCHEFHSIPLHRIMTCGDGDPSRCVLVLDGKLHVGGWGRCRCP